MIGTLINVITVLIGGGIGCLVGAKLPDRLRQTIVVGLGLFTLLLGVQMFLKAQNVLVILGSILIGALLGEWVQIEERLNSFGEWLEKRTVKSGSESNKARFVHGFLTTSLLFCVGPMSILGSIQDGLSGDFSVLAVKSTLDGFAALAFASSLGVGVLFSSLIVLVYQGGISLLAMQVQNIVSPTMMNEMTAVGGVMISGIAVGSLLQLRQVRIASFLPALLIAPLLVYMMDLLSRSGIF